MNPDADLIERVKKAMYLCHPQIRFDDNGSIVGFVPWEEYKPAPFGWFEDDAVAAAVIRAVDAFRAEEVRMPREEFVAALVRYGDAVAAAELAKQHRDWDALDELVDEGVVEYQAVMRLAGYDPDVEEE